MKGKKDQESEAREEKEIKQRLISIFELYGKMVKLAKDRSKISPNKTSSRLQLLNRNLLSITHRQTQAKVFSVSAATQTDQSSFKLDKPCSIFQESILTERKQSEMMHDVSEIPHKSDIIESLSFFMSAYKFMPRDTPYLKKFKIIGQSFEYMAEEAKLTQVISNIPISTEDTQSIGLKIIHSPAMSIYMGLANGSRLNERHSAKARDGSTISFHPTGKVRLHVLTDQYQPKFMPKIQNGDLINMVVNYQRQQIRWLRNESEMEVTNRAYAGKRFSIRTKLSGDIGFDTIDKNVDLNCFILLLMQIRLMLTSV